MMNYGRYPVLNLKGMSDYKIWDNKSYDDKYKSFKHVRKMYEIDKYYRESMTKIGKRSRRTTLWILVSIRKMCRRNYSIKSTNKTIYTSIHIYAKMCSDSHVSDKEG